MHLWRRRTPPWKLLLRSPTATCRKTRRPSGTIWPIGAPPAFRRSPAGALRRQLLAFQQAVGYEGFLRNLERLSPAYRAYRQRIALADESFRRQFPEAAGAVRRGTGGLGPLPGMRRMAETFQAVTIGMDCAIIFREIKAPHQAGGKKARPQMEQKPFSLRPPLGVTHSNIGRTSI